MTTREADLDALMARLATGDRSAFPPLHSALRPRAFRLVAMRLGGVAASASSAEDVTQSALLKVFANASEFTPGKPCLPWFYAVVANEIRAARRRERRLVVVGDFPEDESGLIDERDPEALFIEREIERALEIAVSALDTDSANAILALLGRQPLPDVPAATFRKRVSRAYAKLRVLLGGGHAP